jgi:hypothetical protein
MPCFSVITYLYDSTPKLYCKNILLMSRYYENVSNGCILNLNIETVFVMVASYIPYFREWIPLLYSILPWIVSAEKNVLCRWIYSNFLNLLQFTNSKKNSSRGNYSQKYGRSKKRNFFFELLKYEHNMDE